MDYPFLRRPPREKTIAGIFPRGADLAARAFGLTASFSYRRSRAAWEARIVADAVSARSAQVENRRRRDRGFDETSRAVFRESDISWRARGRCGGTSINE